MASKVPGVVGMSGELGDDLRPQASPSRWATESVRPPAIPVSWPGPSQNCLKFSPALNTVGALITPSFPFDADRHPAPVVSALPQVVAARARDGAVLGQQGFVEERPSERGLRRIHVHRLRNCLDGLPVPCAVPANARCACEQDRGGGRPCTSLRAGGTERRSRNRRAERERGQCPSIFGDASGEGSTCRAASEWGLTGPSRPAGRVMRVTVPWSGRELTLTSPSYFAARWLASVRPSPSAPSREV